MITYVNSNNTDKYSYLWSEASKDLRTHDANGVKVNLGDANALLQFVELTGDKALTAEEYIPGRYYVKNENKDFVLCEDPVDAFDDTKTYYQSDDITSLDEYFSYIVELNKINKKYTILPLDEEVFEIDANTRTIQVPDSFKSHISVQGDEVAEIVYFRIDRFFDSMDLALRDIYIEWKSAAKDSQGKEITGVSVPWVIDIESDPGHIIFGWALSSKITQAAGTVTFAVRFYTFDKEKELLEYSLSTLQQTATIKPSLNFNLKDIILDGTLIDNPDTLISDRFKNSELSAGAVKAETPVWLIDLKTDEDTDVEVDEETGKKVVYVDLNADEAGFRTVALGRDVLAMAPDAGQISYTWKKYDLDDNKKLDIDFAITYVKTTDDARIPGKLYYIAGPDVPFILAPDGVTFDKTSPDYVDIYEKRSHGIINSIGKYVVVCTNRVKNSTAINETWTLVVRRPEEPVITTNIPTSGILDGEFKLPLAVETTVPDNGVRTYQWFKKLPGATGEEDAWIAIADATDDSYQIEGAAATENDASGCLGDGLYMVEITNNLNVLVPEKDAEGNLLPAKNATATIGSGVCRVTHKAEPMVITVMSELSYAMSDIEKGDHLEIRADFREGSGEVIQRTDDDDVTYQWYLYKLGPNTTVDDDVEKADKGEYKVHNDRMIPDATEPTYVPTETGYFFCEVTNHYNGTTASKVSKFFTVVDA